MQATSHQFKIIMSVCSLIALDGEDAAKLPSSSDGDDSAKLPSSSDGDDAAQLPPSLGALLPVTDITGSPYSDGSDFWANEVASFEHQASPKKVICVVTYLSDLH